MYFVLFLHYVSDLLYYRRQIWSYLFSQSCVFGDFSLYLFRTSNICRSPIKLILVSGMDVVTAIATIPTYKPAERIRLFNDFAEFIGDERAQVARTMWNKPLKTVYISDCGELKVAKPSLTPTLP